MNAMNKRIYELNSQSLAQLRASDNIRV